MSVVERIIRPGVDVSVHMWDPGRSGTGSLCSPVHISGTMFATYEREAVNISDIRMEATQDGIVSYIAVWMDQQVEGVCQIPQPEQAIAGQDVIIRAGELRLRFG